ESNAWIEERLWPSRVAASQSSWILPACVAKCNKLKA
ncbi:hypothetical protein E5Q_04436, partial [Mixia osmundae IAM 14324]